MKCRYYCLDLVDRTVAVRNDACDKVDFKAVTFSAKQNEEYAAGLPMRLPSRGCV